MRARFVLVLVLVLSTLGGTASLADDIGLPELARLQTDLNRVAAGQAPLLPLSDPRERLVAAFYAGWGSPQADPAKAAPILNEIEADSARRLAALSAKFALPENWPFRQTLDDLRQYFVRLDYVAHDGADPLVRFIAALHRVDSLMMMENIYALYGIWFWSRASDDPFRDPLTNNAWLRVPCRTLIGREDEFYRAYRILGELAGPALDCPGVSESDSPESFYAIDHFGRAPIDIAAQDRFAHDPGAQAAATAWHPVPPPPPPPVPQPPPLSADQQWDHQVAVKFMATDPDRAEAVLARSATPGEKLDYALFLFAFHPGSQERDDRIRSLLPAPDDPATTPAPFDGSIDTLIDIIIRASEDGIATTESYGNYRIPCAVLARNPKLLGAIAPQYFSLREGSVPDSACGRGDGIAPGFPAAAVRALVGAAEAPTYGFVTQRIGSMAYGFQKLQRSAIEKLRLDPHGLLSEAPTASPAAAPYRVWSYMSLENRTIQARTEAKFETAKTAVSAYFQRAGLTTADADRAADAGLRKLMFGVDCGSADGPTPSLRTLLMDGASLAEIGAFIAAASARSAVADVAEEAPEIDLCTRSAGIDPLAQIAVARPDALPLLWNLIDPNDRNAFGKTPLMTAAQFDIDESVRLLLEHGADPNARTNPTGLGWAERTPLMYAAANASLAVIKRLLQAGADPQMADSKGLKPLHYLLGLGPVPPNPGLTSAELAEAARLLY